MKSPAGRRRSAALSRLRRRLRRLGRGASNALEILARGRIGAPYEAPYAVVLETPRFRPRHYSIDPGPDAGPDDPDPAAARTEPLLLVPPLMVTAPIYDICPELSAVGYLGGRGVDVWLVDYGAPEREEGGMERTLDDHVLAVDQAVDAIRRETGRPVHLAGYSHGGLFVSGDLLRRDADGDYWFVARIGETGRPLDGRSLP